MILDRLENAAGYHGLGRRFITAFNYLAATNFHDLPDGRHAIEGDDILAMMQRYQTKLASEGKWEAHRTYADIQYVIAGQELMGIANINDMTVSEPYDEERDVAFFTGDGQTILVPAGFFTVFLPQDVHKPSLLVGRVRPRKQGRHESPSLAGMRLLLLPRLT